MTLSEVVRAALEDLLAGGGASRAGGVHGSTTAPYMTITAQVAPETQRTTSAAEARAYHGSDPTA